MSGIHVFMLGAVTMVIGVMKLIREEIDYEKEESRKKAKPKAEKPKSEKR